MCSTLPSPRINPELQCQHTWSSKQCSAGIPSVTPSISVSLTVWLCILIWATEVFSFFHFFSYLWLCLNTQMACYPSFTLGWVLSIWSPVVAAPWCCLCSFPFAKTLHLPKAYFTSQYSSVVWVYLFLWFAGYSYELLLIEDHLSPSCLLKLLE